MGNFSHSSATTICGGTIKQWQARWLSLYSLTSACQFRILPRASGWRARARLQRLSAERPSTMLSLLCLHWEAGFTFMDGREAKSRRLPRRGVSAVYSPSRGCLRVRPALSASHKKCTLCKAKWSYPYRVLRTFCACTVPCSVPYRRGRGWGGHDRYSTVAAHFTLKGTQFSGF